MSLDLDQANQGRGVTVTVLNSCMVYEYVVVCTCFTRSPLHLLLARVIQCNAAVIPTSTLRRLIVFVTLCTYERTEYGRADVQTDPWPSLFVAAKRGKTTTTELC